MQLKFYYSTLHACAPGRLHVPQCPSACQYTKNMYMRMSLGAHSEGGQQLGVAQTGQLMCSPLVGICTFLETALSHCCSAFALMLASMSDQWGGQHKN